MAILGDFQGLTGVKKGGRGSKCEKIGVTSFMDGPLDVYAINAKGRSAPVRLKTRTRKVHADVKYSFSAGKKYCF